MKNVIIGSWALFCDEFSGENVMVKIVDKNDDLKVATVLMNLAVQRGESPQKYRMEVPYSSLKQPTLRLKQKRARK